MNKNEDREKHWYDFFPSFPSTWTVDSLRHPPYYSREQFILAEPAMICLPFCYSANVPSA